MKKLIIIKAGGPVEEMSLTNIEQQVQFTFWKKPVLSIFFQTLSSSPQ